jgi:hypothetical protein
MASDGARKRFQACLHVGEHAHPGLGQRYRSLCPDEESLTQEPLKLPNLLADRPRGDMKLVGGPCEAQSARDRLEGTK